MKKKLLTTIIAFIAITMSSSAYAQVSQTAAGTYAGTLEVYMMEPNKIPLGSSAENIYLTSTDANHVTLEIRNFSFPLVGELGDIVIPDVALEEEGDVINILPKTVKITLKVVGEVNVILNKSTIKDKEITLSLNVETTPPYPDMYIYVDFKGTMTATGISDVTLNKPTVYYNPSIDAIMVQGAENQKYDIYNVTGMQILSGVLNTEEVSVSTLSRGLYLIKIGNTTVKFIKK
ncbi:calycin-like domain-containing protein [Bacteroides nordii]|uniref:calycin-like domain-containing protein n=1 Tax=Bacteroides nordii TaxID=291645 RepID=UPI00203B6EF7|nr:calycin-like domain-containing protein [Bacteroides nordii]GFZ39787.1 hypothetical protein BANORC5_18220 [Bacteroides nordii]